MRLYDIFIMLVYVVSSILYTKMLLDKIFELECWIKSIENECEWLKNEILFGKGEDNE